jgi:excisionase family DNA binding protein
MLLAMDKLLLRPNEAAELLGLGRSKLYELIAAGTIPALRVGRSLRVPLDGLRRWVVDQSSSSQDN